MKTYIAIIPCSVVVAAGWALTMFLMATPARTPAALEPAYHPPYDPQKIDREIRFHEGRVRRDPKGAIGWSMLSGAYLARSRESDSYVYAVKAEEAARTSLGLRREGNLGAQTRLINSLLQQHRFIDALATVEAALKLWVGEGQLTQLHAQILIEVGRYDEAESIIKHNPSLFHDPTGEAVRAQLSVIVGKPRQALDLLRQAASEVDANENSAPEIVAWFKVKIGETLAAMGRAAEAAQAFREGLALYPRDYKAYAGLTRLAADAGDWATVVDMGEKSNAIAQMADIWGLIGDAHAALGDRGAAETCYAKVVALAGKPSGPANGMHEFAGATGGHGHTLDRQYALFCADHSRDLDGAYACVLRELQARRDVYAFDTLAWVALKRGDRAEALAAGERALSRGTQDAQMLYHVAEIDSANGMPKEAAARLRQAIAVDPGSRKFRARLAELTRPAGVGAGATTGAEDEEGDLARRGPAGDRCGQCGRRPTHSTNRDPTPIQKVGRSSAEQRRARRPRDPRPRLHPHDIWRTSYQAKSLRGEPP